MLSYSFLLRTSRYICAAILYKWGCGGREESTTGRLVALYVLDGIVEAGRGLEGVVCG